MNDWSRCEYHTYRMMVKRCLILIFCSAGVKNTNLYSLAGKCINTVLIHINFQCQYNALISIFFSAYYEEYLCMYITGDNDDD